MNKRRSLNKETHEYNQLNKTVKKRLADLRKYNTKLIRTSTEINKNVKVLKVMTNIGSLKIHQLKDISQDVKDTNNDLISKIDSFSKTLPSESYPNRHNRANKKILSVGSEELPEISTEGVDAFANE